MASFVLKLVLHVPVELLFLICLKCFHGYVSFSPCNLFFLAKLVRISHCESARLQLSHSLLLSAPHIASAQTPVRPSVFLQFGLSRDLYFSGMSSHVSSTHTFSCCFFSLHFIHLKHAFLQKPSSEFLRLSELHPSALQASCPFPY